MAFDLSTAQPVYPAADSSSNSAGGFDLSTAAPINQPAPAQPSYLEQALRRLAGGANAVGEGVLSAGPLETALHLGSATIGGLGGGLGFLSQLATNGGNVDDAKQFQQQVQGDLTYQPRTKAGKAMAAAADKAMGLIPQGLNKAGEVTADATGSPLLGAAVNTGGNALLNLLPLKGAAMAARTALRGGEDAATAAASAASPVVPRPAPTTPAELAQQSLDNGTAVGYQLPPNLDPNASTLSRLMQSVAGKANAEQRTAVPNQATTNALGARAIGQNPASVVTRQVLQQIRQAAIDNGYEPIKNLPGEIPVDTQFLRNNAAIKSAHGDALSGNPDVAATANLLNRATFDPAQITDQISTLRSRASDAFAAGRGSAATAFRSQAGELEALLDRHLQDAEDAPKGLLTRYRAARQLIAKTHTIEDNLNPSTGNIDAAGIGQALRNGTPLEGDLRTIADFANAAPSAVAIPKGLPLPSSAATHLAGAALAHSTGGASLALVPAARAFAAKWIQQRNATPGLLQPTSKSFGQTALDAVHGNAAAFAKLYGPSSAGALVSTQGQ